MRTTQKVDSTKFGAQVVEEGEGGGQDTTQVANLGAWWGWGHSRKSRIHQGEQVWVKAIWGCGIQSPSGSSRAFEDVAGSERSHRSNAPAWPKPQAQTV